MQIWVKDIFLFTDFVDFLLATRKKLSSKPGLKKNSIETVLGQEKNKTLVSL